MSEENQIEKLCLICVFCFFLVSTITLVQEWNHKNKISQNLIIVIADKDNNPNRSHKQIDMIQKNMPFVTSILLLRNFFGPECWSDSKLQVFQGLDFTSLEEAFLMIPSLNIGGFKKILWLGDNLIPTKK